MTNTSASTILIRNARVLTLGTHESAHSALRGREAMNDLGVIPRADVLIRNGRVAAVTPHGSSPSPAAIPADTHTIDAHGKVLMPGFVDCHTHACSAGSRIDEWQMKLAGATYQEIAARGGGIMSTVRAVREASDANLRATLISHLRTMLHAGSTTIEVKSGYGLSSQHEHRMLAAIDHARTHTPATLISTALLGHALDPAMPRDAFIAQTITETLPRALSVPDVHAIDAFCETGAWMHDECLALFRAARQLRPDLAIRVHADQFNSLGMVGTALSLKARSVDHLEASTPSDLEALAASETFAVILPNCGFHLDGRYANGRRLIDLGAKLCIATNFNPGSAPCPGLPMTIAIAVRHAGLTPAEAILAATRNPAALLGFTDRAVIAPGARADLLLLRHIDERALAYEFGADPIQQVIVNGELLGPSASS